MSEGEVFQFDRAKSLVRKSNVKATFKDVQTPKTVDRQLNGLVEDLLLEIESSDDLEKVDKKQNVIRPKKEKNDAVKKKIVADVARPWLAEEKRRGKQKKAKQKNQAQNPKQEPNKHPEDLKGDKKNKTMKPGATADLSILASFDKSVIAPSEAELTTKKKKDETWGSRWRKYKEKFNEQIIIKEASSSSTVISSTSSANDEAGARKTAEFGRTGRRRRNISRQSVKIYKNTTGEVLQVKKVHEQRSSKRRMKKRKIRGPARSSRKDVIENFFKSDNNRELNMDDFSDGSEGAGWLRYKRKKMKQRVLNPFNEVLDGDLNRVERSGTESAHGGFLNQLDTKHISSRSQDICFPGDKSKEEREAKAKRRFSHGDDDSEEMSSTSIGSLLDAFGEDNMSPLMKGHEWQDLLVSPTMKDSGSLSIASQDLSIQMSNNPDRDSYSRSFTSDSSEESYDVSDSEFQEGELTLYQKYPGLQSREGSSYTYTSESSETSLEMNSTSDTSVVVKDSEPIVRSMRALRKRTHDMKKDDFQAYMRHRPYAESWKENEWNVVLGAHEKREADQQLANLKDQAKEAQYNAEYVGIIPTFIGIPSLYIREPSPIVSLIACIIFFAMTYNYYFIACSTLLMTTTIPLLDNQNVIISTEACGIRFESSWNGEQYDPPTVHFNAWVGSLQKFELEGVTKSAELLGFDLSDLKDVHSSDKVVHGYVKYLSEEGVTDPLEQGAQTLFINARQIITRSSESIDNELKICSLTFKTPPLFDFNLVRIESFDKVLYGEISSAWDYTLSAENLYIEALLASVSLGDVNIRSAAQIIVMNGYIRFSLDSPPRESITESNLDDLDEESKRSTISVVSESASVTIASQWNINMYCSQGTVLRSVIRALSDIQTYADKDIYLIRAIGTRQENASYDINVVSFYSMVYVTNRPLLVIPSSRQLFLDVDDDRLAMSVSVHYMKSRWHAIFISIKTFFFDLFQTILGRDVHKLKTSASRIMDAEIQKRKRQKLIYQVNSIYRWMDPETGVWWREADRSLPDDLPLQFNSSLDKVYVDSKGWITYVTYLGIFHQPLFSTFNSRSQAKLYSIKSWVDTESTTPWSVSFQTYSGGSHMPPGQWRYVSSKAYVGAARPSEFMAVSLKLLKPRSMRMELNSFGLVCRDALENQSSTAASDYVEEQGIDVNLDDALDDSNHKTGSVNEPLQTVSWLSKTRFAAISQGAVLKPGNPKKPPLTEDQGNLFTLMTVKDIANLIPNVSLGLQADESAAEKKMKEQAEKDAFDTSRLSNDLIWPGLRIVERLPFNGACHEKLITSVYTAINAVLTSMDIGQPIVYWDEVEVLKSHIVNRKSGFGGAFNQYNADLWTRMKSATPSRPYFNLYSPYVRLFEHSGASAATVAHQVVLAYVWPFILAILINLSVSLYLGFILTSNISDIEDYFLLRKKSKRNGVIATSHRLTMANKNEISSTVERITSDSSSDWNVRPKFVYYPHHSVLLNWTHDLDQSVIKTFTIEVQESLFGIENNLKHFAASRMKRLTALLLNFHAGDAQHVEDPIQLHKESRRVQSASTRLLKCYAINPSTKKIIRNIHIPYMHCGNNQMVLGVQSSKAYRLNNKTSYRFRIHAYDEYGRLVESSRWTQEQQIEDPRWYERTALTAMATLLPDMDSSLYYFCDKFVIQRAPVNIALSFKGICIEVEHSELTLKLENLQRIWRDSHANDVIAPMKKRERFSEVLRSILAGRAIDNVKDIVAGEHKRRTERVAGTAEEIVGYQALGEPLPLLYQLELNISLGRDMESAYRALKLRGIQRFASSLLEGELQNVTRPDKREVYILQALGQSVNLEMDSTNISHLAIHLLDPVSNAVIATAEMSSSEIFTIMQENYRPGGYMCEDGWNFYPEVVLELTTPTEQQFGTFKADLDLLYLKRYVRHPAFQIVLSTEATFIGDHPGEGLQNGLQYEIKWVWNDRGSEQVEIIYLHLYDGKTERLISSINGGKGIPNTGSYSWTVWFDLPELEVSAHAYFVLTKDPFITGVQCPEIIANSNTFVIVRSFLMSEFEYAYAGFCKYYDLEMERVSKEKLTKSSINVIQSKLKVTSDIRRPLPFEPRCYNYIFCPGQKMVAPETIISSVFPEQTNIFEEDNPQEPDLGTRLYVHKTQVRHVELLESVVLTTDSRKWMWWYDVFYIKNGYIHPNITYIIGYVFNTPTVYKFISWVNFRIMERILKSDKRFTMDSFVRILKYQVSPNIFQILNTFLIIWAIATPGPVILAMWYYMQQSTQDFIGTHTPLWAFSPENAFRDGLVGSMSTSYVYFWQSDLSFRLCVIGSIFYLVTPVLAGLFAYPWRYSHRFHGGLPVENPSNFSMKYDRAVRILLHYPVMFVASSLAVACVLWLLIGALTNSEKYLSQVLMGLMVVYLISQIKKEHDQANAAIRDFIYENQDGLITIAITRWFHSREGAGGKMATLEQLIELDGGSHQAAIDRISMETKQWRRGAINRMSLNGEKVTGILHEQFTRSDPMCYSDLRVRLFRGKHEQKLTSLTLKDRIYRHMLMLQKVSPVYSIEAIESLLNTEKGIGLRFATCTTSQCRDYLEGTTKYSSQISQQTLQGSRSSTGMPGNQTSMRRDFSSALWEPDLNPPRELEILRLDERARLRNLKSVNALLLEYVFKKLNEKNPSALNISQLSWGAVSTNLCDTFVRSQTLLFGNPFKSERTWIEWCNEVYYRFVDFPEDITATSRWQIPTHLPFLAHKRRLTDNAPYNDNLKWLHYETVRRLMHMAGMLIGRLFKQDRMESDAHQFFSTIFREFVTIKIGQCFGSSIIKDKVQTLTFMMSENISDEHQWRLSRVKWNEEMMDIMVRNANYDGLSKLMTHWILVNKVENNKLVPSELQIVEFTDIDNIKMHLFAPRNIKFHLFLTSSVALNIEAAIDDGAGVDASSASEAIIKRGLDKYQATVDEDYFYFSQFVQFIRVLGIPLDRDHLPTRLPDTLPDVVINNAIQSVIEHVILGVRRFWSFREDSAVIDLLASSNGVRTRQSRSTGELVIDMSAFFKGVVGQYGGSMRDDFMNCCRGDELIMDGFVKFRLLQAYIDLKDDAMPNYVSLDGSVREFFMNYEHESESKKLEPLHRRAIEFTNLVRLRIIYSNVAINSGFAAKKYLMGMVMSALDSRVPKSIMVMHLQYLNIGSINSPTLGTVASLLHRLGIDDGAGGKKKRFQFFQCQNKEERDVSEVADRVSQIGAESVWKSLQQNTSLLRTPVSVACQTEDWLQFRLNSGWEPRIERLYENVTSGTNFMTEDEMVKFIHNIGLHIMDQTSHHSFDRDEFQEVVEEDTTKDINADSKIRKTGYFGKNRWLAQHSKRVGKCDVSTLLRGVAGGDLSCTSFSCFDIVLQMAGYSTSTNFSLFLWTLITSDLLYPLKRDHMKFVAKKLQYYIKLRALLTKLKNKRKSSVESAEQETLDERIDVLSAALGTLKEMLMKESADNLAVTAAQVPSFLPISSVYDALIRIIMSPVDHYGIPLLGAAEGGVMDRNQGKYSFSDISEYLGCLPESSFKLLLETKGVLTEKENISELWKLLPKDPICLTYVIPVNYGRFSSKAPDEHEEESNQYLTNIYKRLKALQKREMQRSGRFINVEGDETGLDPCKGLFVGIDTLRVQVPAMLSGGINFHQMVELANRIYGQNVPSKQFSIAEVARKWKHWRQFKPVAFTKLGTLQEKCVIDFLQDLTERGITYDMFMDLIKQMRLDFGEVQIKRIYDTMDVNVDGALDRRELLEGFELLMGEHMPEMVMKSIGFNQMELVKRKLGQFAVIVLILVFLTTAFHSIMVETSTKDSVTQSLLVLAGTFGIQAITAEDIQTIRIRMRAKISVIFGDISHLSNESTEAADLDLTRRLKSASEMANLLKLKLAEGEKKEQLRSVMRPIKLVLEIPPSFIHNSFSMNLTLFIGDYVVIRPKVHFEDLVLTMQRATCGGRPPLRGKLAQQLIKQGQRCLRGDDMFSSDNSEDDSTSEEHDDEEEVDHEGEVQYDATLTDSTESHRLKMKWECHPNPPVHLGIIFDTNTGIIEGSVIHGDVVPQDHVQQLKLLYPATQHTLTMTNSWGSAHAMITFEIWGRE
eukprot:GHVH01015027.1.p1 GENE.GHVH01015027.1~~GHVH01015027.1.p1  ORF type:complete len:4095 (+),score=625.19 GHVH01015027.1:526-12810(+)